MRSIGRALVFGLRAPLRRWRIVLVLWLSRLLPIAIAFGLPIYAQVRERSAHHPDAGLLLNASRDTTGFAHSWTSDFFRDGFAGAADTLFWIVVFTWLLVSCLTGGVLTSLIRGDRRGLFLAECGRYAGRLVRLALLSAFVFYWADFLINGLLSDYHEEAGKLHHVQNFALEKSWIRGTLFLAVAYLLGLIHAYARIDVVAFERRSALLSYLRGFGLLVTRLPSLLVVELVMLGLAALAAFVAWILMKAASPLHAQAGAVSIGAFFVLALVGSYLRTGVEVGAMDARCRLLVPEPEAAVEAELPHFETPELLPEDESGDLLLPPDPADPLPPDPADS